MPLFFSPSTLGFYDDSIGGPDCVPDDAVPVTLEDRLAMLTGESQGKRIAADPETGAPMLIDPPPPSAQELWAARRRRAAAALSATADAALRYIEAGDPLPMPLRTYRAALRTIADAETGDPSAPFPGAP